MRSFIFETLLPKENVSIRTEYFHFSAVVFVRNVGLTSDGNFRHSALFSYN